MESSHSKLNRQYKRNDNSTQKEAQAEEVPTSKDKIAHAFVVYHEYSGTIPEISAKHYVKHPKCNPRRQALNNYIEKHGRLYSGLIN